MRLVILNINLLQEITQNIAADNIYERDEILNEDRQDELTDKIISFAADIDKVDNDVIVYLFYPNVFPSNFIIKI